MNYEKIPQDLPVELVHLIMSFINMTTPSAHAFKDCEIREIKNIELLSKNPLQKGELKLIGFGTEELNQEWMDYNSDMDALDSIYWEGFYDAHFSSAPI